MNKATVDPSPGMNMVNYENLREASEIVETDYRPCIGVERKGRESGRRPRMALDSALDALAVIDGEGHILDWSWQAKGMFGWEQETVRGRPLGEVILAASTLAGGGTDVLDPVRGPGKAGPVRRFVTRGRRRTGRDFPMELTLVPCLLDEAWNWSWTALIRDLSDQEAVWQRLTVQYETSRILSEADDLGRAAQELLSMLVERTPWDLGVLWTADEALGVLFCQGMARRPGMLPNPFEEISRLRMYRKGSGLPGRAWEAAAPVWIEDLAEEGTFRPWRDASDLGLRSGCALPVTQRGAVLGVLEFFSRRTQPRDIDLENVLAAAGRQLGQFLEREQMDREARRSRHKRALMFGKVNDSLMLAEAEGPGRYRIEEVNDAFLAASKFPRELLEGRTVDEVLSGAALDLWRQKAGEALATRSPIQAEWEEPGSGPRRTFDSRWIPVLDAEGGGAHVLMVSRDITALRHKEAELRQAQKMESVGRLAGGIAHDFNNLLTIVNGYSEMALAREGLDEAVRGILTEIHASGQRAAALTRQLLAFSRKQMLTLRPLDLDATVASMETLIRRAMGEKVQVETIRAGGLRPAMLDAGQVDQLLLNLALNARDAMPAGGTLTIETANVELDGRHASTHLDGKPGPHVLLSVSDTGVGMGEEVKSRLFEPFFTTKREGSGTGMGLATVYGIVKQSGGNIHVYSEPGKGTTFRIYFPAVEAAAGSGTGTRAVGPWSPVREAEGSPVGAGRTILLVEDEDGVRGFLRTSLEGRGFRVLEARDGETALEMASRGGGPIHLLLTDMVLPNMCGKSLMEKVTALHGDLRTLFISGYGAGAAHQHGVSDERTAFLQKPFGTDTLLAAVTGALSPAGRPPGVTVPS